MMHGNAFGRGNCSFKSPLPGNSGREAAVNVTNGCCLRFRRHLSLKLIFALHTSTNRLLFIRISESELSFTRRNFRNYQTRMIRNYIHLTTWTRLSISYPSLKSKKLRYGKVKVIADIIQVKKLTIINVLYHCAIRTYTLGSSAVSGHKRKRTFTSIFSSGR